MTAGCEQGKSAEAEWTSELKERTRPAQIVQFGNCTRYHAELLRRIETIQLANYKSDAGFFLPVASRQGILFKAGVNLGGTTGVPSRPNGRRGLLIFKCMSL